MFSLCSVYVQFEVFAKLTFIVMLRKVHVRGGGPLQLFSNSPMWWACGNHNPSGSATGLTDNLQSWNQGQHAQYLATVAMVAKAKWGIGEAGFDSVEAFNEPVSLWWNAHGTQEGCHFGHATQATVSKDLRNALDAAGLNDTAVAASDENTYTEALSTWKSLDASAKEAVGLVTVHGYEQGNGRRDLLFAAVKGKRLWNSEYGEGDASGMSLATNLNLDFRWLHNTAWVYWQVMDGGGWGLLDSDPVKGTIKAVNTKYVSPRTTERMLHHRWY